MNTITENRRTTRYMVILLTALLLCGAGILCAKADPAFAEDTPDSAVALEVYQDEDLIRTFTKAELEALADSQEYTYSAFNANPSVEKAENVRGVRLERILEEAAPDGLRDDQIIEFTANDGVKVSFLKNQILAKRYCFPGIDKESGRNGKAPLAASRKGKQLVPAIISLYDNENGSDRRLLFGQISPSEQTFQKCLRYMLAKGRKDSQTGEVTVTAPGRITLRSGGAERWNGLETTNAGAGGAVRKGTEIAFDLEGNPPRSRLADKYCVYYTTDGSEPGVDSELYNYNNFNAGQEKEKFNKPLLDVNGTVTIKTKVIGYGKEDSPVTTFEFSCGKVPDGPSFRSVSSKGRSVSLKWKKTSGASGYKIYRASKRNGPYELVRTIAKGKTVSWKDTKLKKKAYYYRILSFKSSHGVVFSSRLSAVKKIKVR